MNFLVDSESTVSIGQSLDSQTITAAAGAGELNFLQFP